MKGSVRACFLAFVCTVILLGGRAAYAVAATCGGSPAQIVGTPGNDRIVGTAGPDVIQALEGDDVIRGLGGSDHICGGDGGDIIYAGPRTA
jgi:Ca2+-binding RTX toxin-like protein